MLAQHPASARSLMDSRLRRLLPSWLSSQQPSSSHSNIFPESDPQRTGSVGCKVSATVCFGSWAGLELERGPSTLYDRDMTQS